MKTVRVLAAVAVVLGAAAALVQDRSRPGRPDGPRAYWWGRALGTRAHNRAAAILVSRFRFQRLKALKSWQDVPGLRNYVEWADRSEAAGFRGGVITANVSANDLILLRVPAAAVECRAPVYKDPIGYAVLDPGRSGWVRIPVTLLVVQVPLPTLPPGLPAGPVPGLDAAVAAGSGTVVVYGDSLKGRRVRIFSRRGEGKVLYDSPVQMNAGVPSLDEVAVEVDGIRSDWVEVRK